MKTREEVARFVERQFEYSYECALPKPNTHHYGRQEARELLDFIYGGEPRYKSQRINGVNTL